MYISFVFPGTKLEINNNKTKRKPKEWEKVLEFQINSISVNTVSPFDTWLLNIG